MKKIILVTTLLCSCLFSGAKGTTTTFVNREVIDISAASAVVIEAKSGKIIYEKNANEVRQMASTTKIMTTLLTLTQTDYDLDEYFTVDSEAIRVEGSSMGLTEGDSVTLRTLCYGMMLPSGNDAANASAVKVSGSIEAFVERMNEKAREIGLKNTNFVTPSGLDDYTDDHYSTAYEMALLTREALKNPDFREICSSKNVKLNYGNPTYDRWLTNSNKLLTNCEGVIGVKTGFTDKAGRCLVSACERDGVTLICVTLKAGDDWNDHKKLYDKCFFEVETVKYTPKTEGIKIPVVGSDVSVVNASLERSPNLEILAELLDKVEETVIVPRFLYSPIELGDKVGEVVFKLNGEEIERVNLLASEDAFLCEEIHEEKGILDRIFSFLNRFLKRDKD